MSDNNPKSISDYPQMSNTESVDAMPYTLLDALPMI